MQGPETVEQCLYTGRPACDSVQSDGIRPSRRTSRTTWQAISDVRWSANASALTAAKMRTDFSAAVTVLLSLLTLICIAAESGSASAEDFQVTSPPQSLRSGSNGAEVPVDPLYKKFISANGYPILASKRVDDYALKEAAYLVDTMLANRPDVRQAMIESGSRMLVFAHNEFTTDLPEYSGFTPKDYWDRRSRGFGGSLQDPVCSVAEENLLGFAGDPYKTECILIHEFAHNIHLRGLVHIDETFDRRLREAYDSSLGQGLWKGKYAAVNHYEYWAEGVQSWFSNNRQPDHDHNHVDTREELIEYDSRLAQLCREVFGDTKLVYSKPATRLVGHMKGYDPAQAPTFVWPQRLKEIQLNLELKWTPAAGIKAPNSVLSKTETWVMFRNQSAAAVKIGWVDFDGEFQMYKKLRPRGDFAQQTFAGHTWMVTDTDGKSLGYFVASPAIAHATVPR
ncbi:MAG: hypothetical protein ACI9HK_002589 [Pirellulaceae bacterium]|jgi:hypothetical protein